MLPASACEEAIPVATESSVSLSEASKTHKKTRAFREDGAGACFPGGAGERPQVPLPCAARWPGALAGRSGLRTGFRDGVGWSLQVFGMSVRGQAAPAPTPSRQGAG